MKKSITLWMPVLLLLGLCMAVPMSVMAAGKHTGTVLRSAPTSGPLPSAELPPFYTIDPPRWKHHTDLDPYDAYFTYDVSWFCEFAAPPHAHAIKIQSLFVMAKSNNKSKRKYAISSLKQWADIYSKAESDPADDFWAANHGETWKAKPAQGEKVTHTWHNCYKMQQLEAMKQEAVRWAKYMKNIWLPKHKGGRK